MATYLLKKSYQLKDLKEIKFKDLWDTHGVFTTMWIFKNPTKILFFQQYIENLIQSLKAYKLNTLNIKKTINKILKLNLKKNIKYNHLLRIAVNKNIISISIRKRRKIESKFKLKLINYRRKQPTYKNLKYKKILKFLSKIDTSKVDICLCFNNKLLETATCNLLFVKKNKIYSPENNFYEGITLKFFNKKIKSIIKKNILINSLDFYDEIILVGSGKGVVSVESVEKTKWKRKSLKTYRFLSKIYNRTVTKCPLYNS